MNQVTLREESRDPSLGSYELALKRGTRELMARQGRTTDRAWKLGFYRRVSWFVVADRLEERMRSAVEEVAALMPWEQLYIHREDGRKSLTLFYGQHPVPSASGRDREFGCSLVVAQDTRGMVSVLLFPFESLVSQMIKPKVIWGAFDGPAQLSDGVIRTMLRDFFIYGRASSAVLAASRRDRSRVVSMEQRSRTLEAGHAKSGLQGAAQYVLWIGSIATAALLSAWFALDKGSLEPIAALVALGTSWVAVFAQRSAQARERAIARALGLEETERAERDRRLAQRRADVMPDTAKFDESTYL